MLLAKSIEISLIYGLLNKNILQGYCSGNTAFAFTFNTLILHNYVTTDEVSDETSVVITCKLVC